MEFQIPEFLIPFMPKKEDKVTIDDLLSINIEGGESDAQKQYNDPDNRS